jgi:hypothetical protein
LRVGPAVSPHKDTDGIADVEGLREVDHVGGDGVGAGESAFCTMRALMKPYKIHVWRSIPPKAGAGGAPNLDGV